MACLIFKHYFHADVQIQFSLGLFLNQSTSQIRIIAFEYFCSVWLFTGAWNVHSPDLLSKPNDSSTSHDPYPFRLFLEV